MSMKNLPAEMILRIFKACDSQKDVSNLRLVCKDLAAIGSQHLVDCLHVTLRARSFQNLKSISQHPKFSKSVKRVTYEGDVLREVDYQIWLKYIPALSDSKTWSKCIPATPRFFGIPFSIGWAQNSKYDPETAYTQKGLESAFRAYKNEASMVKNIVEQNLDFYMLASTFLSFPKLESVELILGGSTGAFEYRGNVSETLKAAFRHTLVLPHFFPFQTIQERKTRGVRQLKSVLLAIVSSGAKLKDLSVGAVDWSFFEAAGEVNAGSVHNGFQWRYDSLDEPCKDGYYDFSIAPELYLPAFAHLESLSLAIQSRETMGDFWSVPHGGFPRAARLGDAIIAAQGLVNLSLTFEDPNCSICKLLPLSMGLTTWDSICRQSKWPCLENFTLIHAPFSGGFFLDFLKRHAETIRSLDLDNIRLTTWTVEEFFGELKNAIDMSINLEEINLGGRFLCTRYTDQHVGVVHSILMDDFPVKRTFPMDVEVDKKHEKEGGDYGGIKGDDKIDGNVNEEVGGEFGQAVFEETTEEVSIGLEVGEEINEEFRQEILGLDSPSRPRSWTCRSSGYVDSEVDDAPPTLGGKIIQYLLQGGEYPFDLLDYWPAVEGEAILTLPPEPPY